MNPLYKFRLHIKKNEFGHKGYFLIQVWEKKQDMEAHTQYKAHAVTVLPYTPTGKASKVIVLNFWVKRLGLEYTLHELLHAVLEWCRRNELQVQYYNDKFYRDEEFFCQVCGELAKQFYKKLHNLGLTEQYDFLESRDFR